MNKRHKNVNWNLPTNGNGIIESWDYVKIAVLMDIRDELQTLNSVFRCHNFLKLPHDIRKMRIALERKRRKAKAKCPA